MSIPMDTHEKMVADEKGEPVDQHEYRANIGSLMYLISSRPNIMFVVCVCPRFQANPKVYHMLVVKRIFRYVKGKPDLGIWYPKNNSFDLTTFTNSDYDGCNMSRKSTSEGCQFIGNRLVSWQCKKQTVVSFSTAEAEYIATSTCCAQVLWIQSALLDYGLNFLLTPIYIDNIVTIFIVTNPVHHSKTKYIEIRHHFIRDCNKKD
ncbi:secreted RxLR effector protein 161-like [Bidens hawaiensis]|uniref:secreted RxLR effector protein 161-like n=1 Tax=Bidens hawaiensis TaxID=980011 RepID=UPI00404AC3C3